MAVEADLTPSSYIQHHLANLTASVGEGEFWTLHLDTLISSLVLGGIMYLMFWAATRKATSGV
ncbi:MAG: F0F1 ATP synthase subunit A, partial [Gammaproteobacteria bacterium]|nr:F0F1 ATP synthase subunit A [Gammaproteobacteria bacterium]